MIATATAGFVLNLVEFGRIRIKADHLDVESIDREGRLIVIKFRPNARLDGAPGQGGWGLVGGHPGPARVCKAGFGGSAGPTTGCRLEIASPRASGGRGRAAGKSVGGRRGQRLVR